jgi:thiol-disulfide isomerase/thioredoxin
MYSKDEILTPHMKLVFIFLLAPCLPLLAQVTYQEGLDNCRRIAEVNSKSNPGVMGLTNPDCMIGASAPEFSALTLDGKPFTTQSLKGKITVLNFWMISCPPCIAEIPGLNNVVQKYGRENFNFIAIGMDDEKDINHFLIRNPWSFDQIASGSSLIFDVFKIGWGFPTTFVLDQDGVIIGAFSGGKTDESAVQKIQENLAAIFALAGKGN